MHLQEHLDDILSKFIGKEIYFTFNGIGMNDIDRGMTATLKYAITSDTKMNLVAKIIRWKDASAALDMLQFMPKKAAKILLKVVKSAVHNAKQKFGHDVTWLYVSKIDVWRWPALKRMRFVWSARMHAYQKYRSFVRVMLEKK